MTTNERAALVALITDWRWIARLSPTSGAVYGMCATRLEAAIAASDGAQPQSTDDSMRGACDNCGVYHDGQCDPYTLGWRRGRNWAEGAQATGEAMGLSGHLIVTGRQAPAAVREP
jgi:hypothetical protein